MADISIIQLSDNTQYNIKDAKARDTIDSLNEKMVSIGDTAPTEGERVWFKNSDNLFDKSAIPVNESNTTITELPTGIRATVSNAGTNRYASILLNGDKLLGKTLTLSATISVSASNNALLRVFFWSGSAETTKINTTNLSSTGSITFTVPNAYPSGSNGIVITFNANSTGTSQAGDYVDYTNVMLNEGSTAKPYAMVEKSIYVDEMEWYAKPIVLWTNPNPAAEFGNQFVDLSTNVSDFAYFEILYSMSTSQPDVVCSTGKIPTNKAARFTVPSNTLGYRGAQIRSTKTQVSFGNYTQYSTYGGTGTTTNTIAIPYQILGYKRR